jgi:long-chain acyl-CoA synthetase
MEDFSGINDSVPVFEASAGPKEHYRIGEDDLAAIIYTSGTTGSSKGVMLSHKNICSNVVASRQLHPVDHHDRFMSILPLSHTLENTIGFLIPMMNGACVYYLEKPPSPGHAEGQAHHHAGRSHGN